MKRSIGLRLLLGFLMVVVRAQGAEAAPVTRPASVDEKLWNLMVEIDARAGRIDDLQADFTQEKFTPLLKKPLVSSGRIAIKGAAALWTTTQPEPTLMRIDAKEVRLLYPKQKVLEIYASDRNMSSLTASPFPRLEVLKQHFTFEQMAAEKLLAGADARTYLALKLRPIEPELRKHIEEVCVLLEIASGLAVRAQTVDADGDRMVLTFSNIKVNVGVLDHDVALSVPEDVTVTHPLEGGQSRDPKHDRGSAK